MPFTPQQLSDLEDIRQLKHRYFRCIDTGAEAELAGLFTEDVRIELRGGGYVLKLQGRAEMVEFIASAFNSSIVAMHQGHMPEIRFTGPDEAEGAWYLEDRFINPDRNEDTTGTAIYRDRYVRQADGWRIASSQYDRVFEIVRPVDPDMRITAHLLAKTGRPPERRSDISKYLTWFEDAGS